MRLTTFRVAALCAAIATPLLTLALGVPAASAKLARQTSPAPNVFTVHQILSGTTLSHSFTPAGSSQSVTEKLSNPDDITRLGSDLFVGFQNGVGAQGQASADGNVNSTIVELALNGEPLAQWDIQGKADGVTADPWNDSIIATVNEDANSSVYVIHQPADATTARITHFTYSTALAHDGGTDAVSIYRGRILISASAPGTTGVPSSTTSPAVYVVRLSWATSLASVAPLFDDTSSAVSLNGANTGSPVALALSDPDSSEIVPEGARFAGDFMLTSQGDLQQIFVSRAGTPDQHLSALSLSQSVDDTAWPTSAHGRLYSTDATHDTVDAVSGPFEIGQPLVVATPCGSNSAPSSCPAPPTYPANYLGSLDPTTGSVSAVTVVGAPYLPQGGLIFVPRDADASSR